MKEYSLLAAGSLIAVFFLNKVTRVKIFGKIEYYIFLVVIFGFKLLVNGYLTGTNIVEYNPQFFLGRRLGSIPIEDFFFGFSMVSLTLIFWEYFKKGNK